MNTFSKSILAFTGLALSLAACGPGFKGEASKRPDVLGRFAKTSAQEYKKLEGQPQIGSIVLEKKSKDEDQMIAMVKLENVADLKKKNHPALVQLEAKDLGTVEPETIVGGKNSYTIEVVLLDDGLVAGILTTSPLPQAKQTEVSTEAPTEVSTEVTANATAPAPEEILDVAAEAQVIRTGVVVETATGEVLHAAKIEKVEASLDEDVKELTDALAKAQKLGQRKTKL